MRLLIALILFLTSSTAWAAGECDIAREAIAKASEIRHLKIKKPVPCLVHNQEQVKNFILEQLKEEIPQQKLVNEEAVFKALGFIPEDYNYQQGIVDLYVSQLGGYYDPKREHFVMAGWMPEVMQPTVAAHELTHALQDQYFNLDAFVDHSRNTSDTLLARSALVEGDATAVMVDYLRSLGGQPGIATTDDISSILLQNAMGASLSSGMKETPQSMQLLLLFPYTSGLRFAHTLLRKGGYAEIDAAFRSPPRSTEEILHPEKFGKDADFIEIADSDLLTAAKAPQGKIIYSDSYGEFAISALLGNFIVDKFKVTEASSGWGGDRVAIVENKERTMVWLTRWDTNKDAEEFFTLFSAARDLRVASGKTSRRLEASKAGRTVTVTTALH